MTLQEYTNVLPGWMKYFGFEEVPVHPQFNALKIFRRTKFEATKFGNEAVYCFVNHVPETITYNELSQISSTNFSYAAGTLMSHYNDGVRGIGSMLVVFNLFLVEKISQEQYRFSTDYCPKHFAAAEFPSVLDLSTSNIYYYQKTPVWGWAYYNGYRTRSFQFFSPQSWARVGK
ncbi:MAG TPA: hypothetical protein VHP32_12480 [Ignavibacteria bacterium]|nr:hypothetical protein [Ignavibacteria bacterium]